MMYLAIKLLHTSTCWYLGHITLKLSCGCSVFQMNHITGKYCLMPSQMIEQKDLRFHLIKVITLNTFSLCRCLQLVKRFLVVVVFQDTCTLTWPQFMRYSLLVVCSLRNKRCRVQIWWILPIWSDWYWYVLSLLNHSVLGVWKEEMVPLHKSPF